ncbi:hypothetical protein L1049_012866 [Liquidambar formosana]|uniref:DDE Tnp4 domain-containing protein n=1 Tax=Liquidambar formosana TaxID=63359 RepID=A0AAP0WX28_LIQFO
MADMARLMVSKKKEIMCMLESLRSLLNNCLGALDGTYIRVNVPEADKPRYRTRKNDIATNVLGVCSQDMQFTFVLPGWEGSAADSRVFITLLMLDIPMGRDFLPHIEASGIT